MVLGIILDICVRKARQMVLWLPFLLLLAGCQYDLQPTFEGENVGPVTLDRSELDAVKERVKQGDTLYTYAYRELVAEADSLLNVESYSVVRQGTTPPSGDNHDYMTLATYAWPNPETPDGLPYIIRDGQRNPEVDNYDRAPIAHMSRNVFTLSLAYHFTDNTEYAEQAVRQIRTWFLNKETYMNPHLKYAQSIPGMRDGSSQGVVESREFIDVLDGVGLIYDSPFWSREDQIELQVWFHEYLNWLSHSRNPNFFQNNIGTWFDAQILSFALYTEQNDRLKAYAAVYPKRRIDTQINQKGVQSLEISRAKAQHYTYFNMNALVKVARLSQKGGFNLWKYNESSGSMRNVLEFLKPFALGEQEWRQAGFSQIDPFNRCRYIELFKPAANVYQSQEYADVVKHLYRTGCRDTQALLTSK